MGGVASRTQSPIQAIEKGIVLGTLRDRIYGAALLGGPVRFPLCLWGVTHPSSIPR